MVDISLVVLVIFVISTVFGIYKLIKFGITLAALLSVAFSVALLVMGVALYMDVNEFQEKFETAPKLFLLKENRTLLAGFSGRLGTTSEQAELLTAAALADLQADYDANKLDGMRGGNYKLFFVDLVAFGNITGRIMVDDTEYGREEIIQFIHSQAPLDDFTEDLLARREVQVQQRDAAKKRLLKGLRENAPDDTAFRANLFTLLLAQAVKEQGSRFLLYEFQRDHIRIYPETALFKLVKYIPPRYLSQILQEETTPTSNATGQA